MWPSTTSVFLAVAFTTVLARAPVSQVNAVDDWSELARLVDEAKEQVIIDLGVAKADLELAFRGNDVLYGEAKEYMDYRTLAAKKVVDEFLALVPGLDRTYLNFHFCMTENKVLNAAFLIHSRVVDLVNESGDGEDDYYDALYVFLESLFSSIRPIQEELIRIFGDYETSFCLDIPFENKEYQSINGSVKNSIEKLRSLPKIHKYLQKLL